ncbi:MAG: metalloregulator ArsR/SmtB family transcription factor [Hyphomonas sp.]|nr:helix-turn-helix transcriptional regulator [Hyphomonas sp.]MCB9970434.1 helix-turn-helix transcriptional regulator [Hyphomonas sp.]
MNAEAHDARVDAVFHALGDVTRRAILERLSRQPAAVSELAAPFAMSLAAVGQHVQILERSGLVRTEKSGRVRTCQIDPEGLSLARQWIDERKRLWEQRFDRLANFLDEDEPE